jgi:hypothetical protein
MTSLRLKNNYIAKLIRNDIRQNFKKYIDKKYFVLDLIEVSAKCMKYYHNNIINIYDNKKNKHIILDQNKKLENFNIACQAGSNLLKTNIHNVFIICDIINQIGYNNKDRKFHMPSLNMIYKFTKIFLKEDFLNKISKKGVENK